MSPFPGYGKILGSYLWLSRNCWFSVSLEQTSHFVTGRAAGSCSSEVLLDFFLGEDQLDSGRRPWWMELRKYYWKGPGRRVWWSCQSHVLLDTWMNVYITVQPISQLSYVRKHSAHGEAGIKANTWKNSLCHVCLPSSCPPPVLLLPHVVSCI